MTPKEKAKELVEKFKEVMPFTDKKLFYSSIDESKSCVEIMEEATAKQCALIAVEEIITPFKYYNGNDYVTRILNPVEERYWQEVKQEIENL